MASDTPLSFTTEPLTKFVPLTVNVMPTPSGVAVGLMAPIVGVRLAAGIGSENSDVLLLASVAVAVMVWPLASVAANVALIAALPLALVVTLAKPKKVCPSVNAPPLAAELTKNSMRNSCSGCC